MVWRHRHKARSQRSSGKIVIQWLSEICTFNPNSSLGHVGRNGKTNSRGELCKVGPSPTGHSKKVARWNPKTSPNNSSAVKSRDYHPWVRWNPKIYHPDPTTPSSSPNVNEQSKFAIWSESTCCSRSDIHIRSHHTSITQTSIVQSKLQQQALLSRTFNHGTASRSHKTEA